MEEVSVSLQSFKIINPIPCSLPTRLLGFINGENNEFARTISIRSAKSNKSAKNRKVHTRLFSMNEVILINQKLIIRSFIFAFYCIFFLFR